MAVRAETGSGESSRRCDAAASPGRPTVHRGSRRRCSAPRRSSASRLRGYDPARGRQLRRPGRSRSCAPSGARSTTCWPASAPARPSWRSPAACWPTHRADAGVPGLRARRGDAPAGRRRGRRDDRGRGAGGRAPAWPRRAARPTPGCARPTRSRRWPSAPPTSCATRPAAAGRAQSVLDRARAEAAEVLRAAAMERDRQGEEAAHERDRLAAAAPRSATGWPPRPPRSAGAGRRGGRAREEAATTAAERLAGLQAEVDDLRRQRDEAHQSLRGLTSRIGEALQAVAATVPDVVEPNIAVEGREYDAAPAGSEAPGGRTAADGPPGSAAPGTAWCCCDARPPSPPDPAGARALAGPPRAGDRASGALRTGTAADQGGHPMDEVARGRAGRRRDRRRARRLQERPGGADVGRAARRRADRRAPRRPGLGDDDRAAARHLDAGLRAAAAGLGAGRPRRADRARRGSRAGPAVPGHLPRRAPGAGAGAHAGRRGRQPAGDGRRGAGAASAACSSARSATSWSTTRRAR